MTKNTTRLPVPTEYFILLALAKGPAHGSGIAQQIIADTVGWGYPAKTSLYRELKQLEAAGMVRTSGERNWERTYSITLKGINILTMHTKVLLMVAQTARQRTRI